jgi:uncharacterized membrane protein
MDEPLIDATGTARLETFSDGVLAIAATLLVLEIGVDSNLHGSLGDALFDLWPSYLAYAASFLTIGIIWVNHHAVFDLIGRVDRTLLFLNTMLLLVVAFFPFPTRLVAEFLDEGGNERTAVLAYGCTLTLMSVFYGALWFYAAIGRRHIAPHVPQSAVDTISKSFAPGSLLYGAATLIAFVSPLATVLITLGIAIFYVPSSWFFFKLENR